MTIIVPVSEAKIPRIRKKIPGDLSIFANGNIGIANYSDC